MEETYRTKKLTLEGSIKLSCYQPNDTFTINWKDEKMDVKDKKVRFHFDSITEIIETLNEDDFESLYIISNNNEE